MNLPNPLVPSDADMRDFPYMPLDVARLRDSGFTIRSTGEGFRTGVILWCAAWHQLPAGSIPNNDLNMAHLAGFGRTLPRGWKKLKEEVLQGWILCSDDRYYHPVVCEKVLSGIEAKIKEQYAKFVDRLRKANKKRSDSGLPTIEIPDFSTWKSCGFPSDWSKSSSGIPSEVGRNEIGNPPNSTLKRIEGKGREEKGTDIKALPPLGEGNSNSVDNFPDLPEYTPPVDDGRRLSWAQMGISQLPEDWRSEVLKDWPELHADDFKAKWTAFTAHFTDKSGDLKTRVAWLQRWMSWMAQDAAKLIADHNRRDSYQRNGGKSENPLTRISRSEIEKNALPGETYEQAEARLLDKKRNMERVV